MKKKLFDDFLVAYKAGEKEKKDCLGILKTRITEWEKNNPGKEITDNDVIGILSSEVKKRKDSAALYTSANTEVGTENAKKEQREIEIIQEYLPKQMTEAELKEKICAFLNENTLFVVAENKAKLARSVFGSMMKEFNTNYKGQYDPQMLKRLAEEILELN